MLTDDPYKAPESTPVESEQSGLPSNLPNRISFVLWCVVGGLATFVLAVMVSALPSGGEILPKERFVTVGALLLSAAGLTLRWGSMIPCAFLSTIVCINIIERYSPIMDVIYWPIVAPVIGAGPGWDIDSFQRRL